MAVYLTKTDKTTLVGLYIAKFDHEALAALGFSGMWQAFNVLGYSLGSSPASIKNYRDEFDRLFPGNPRKGWNRELKTRSKNIFEDFSSLDFDSFTELIKGFLIPHYEDEKAIEAVVKKTDANDSVAKRLITGRAAEEYFKKAYSSIDEFEGYDLLDTTTFACGFDFKLSFVREYYCVEVKGLSQASGSVMFTEKEYNVAHELRTKYCLFVVKNFSERPYHQLFFDPLRSRLVFQRNEQFVRQISFSAVV